MNRKTTSIVLAAVLALGIVASGAALVSAQTGGDYDLTWSTIDGGGAMFSAGGDYRLGGTIGQPDAGIMSGGNYSLVGGLWAGAYSPYRAFLPVVLKLM